MKKKKSNLIIKHFESPNQKNEYLLIDGNETATVDISTAYDAVSHFLGEMGVGLKYLLITHAHKSHVQAVPKLKENFGAPSVSMNTNLITSWSPTKIWNRTSI